LLHEGSRVEALTRSGYTLQGINLPGVGDTYVDPRMASALNDWMASAADQGVDLRFTSAFRINGVAVVGAVYTPVGDTSLHNAGLAVDIRYDRLTDIPGGLTADQQREIIRSTAISSGLSWGGSFGDRVHFFIDPYGQAGSNRLSLIQTQQQAYRFLNK